MRRLRLAVVGTALAVAAGGGLLIAAAGAVPAYASAPAAPAGGHTVTITAHRSALAASGISPHTIQPCAANRGATPASCGQQTIECIFSATTPFVSAGDVVATVTASCSSDVTSIKLTAAMLRNGVSASISRDTDTRVASTLVTATCQDGTYQSTGDALITLPSGFTLAGGSNPIHGTSASLRVFPFGC